MPNDNENKNIDEIKEQLEKRTQDYLNAKHNLPLQQERVKEKLKLANEMEEDIQKRRQDFLMLTILQKKLTMILVKWRRWQLITKRIEVAISSQIQVKSA